MTDTPMNLTTALDELAQSESWRPAIRTALIEDQHDRARHLLVSAMRAAMDRWAAGLLGSTSSLTDACEVVDASPGPLVFREMREAARRELDRVVREFGYPLEA